MLIEVLLKFLVGVVDVELFEPIHLQAETHILPIYVAWSADKSRRA